METDFFGDPIAPMPPPVERKRKPLSEAQIQAQMLAALRRLPQCHAFRVSVLYSEQARRHSAPNGTPDLYVCLRGVSVWIEVKAPNGKVSEDQSRWHEAHWRAGGRVLICRDVAETLRALEGMCP